MLSAGILISAHVALAQVYWDSAEGLVGRVVRLDAASRVMYAPPSGRQSFEAAMSAETMKLLIPFTGVGMRRATGPFREDMPQSMCRLARLCQGLCDQAFSCEWGDEGADCIVCSLPAERSIAASTSAARAHLTDVSGIDLGRFKHVQELVRVWPQEGCCICAWCHALLDQA